MFKNVAIQVIDMLIDGLNKDSEDKTYSVKEITVWLNASKEEFLKHG